MILIREETSAATREEAWRGTLAEAKAYIWDCRLRFPEGRSALKIVRLNRRTGGVTLVEKC